MAAQQRMIPDQTAIMAGFDQALSLLSLDGGGVRGLSSLYILDQIMHSVNTKAKDDPPLKPCEYFDMIGGTSTGGILAIMLGRLRMTVRECIDAYIALADRAFTKEHHRISWKGSVQGRFDHHALESTIIEVIQSAGYCREELLKDETPNACKVFVCALSDRTNTLVTFTTYQAPRVDRELLDQATVLQACRATSAASSFFDPLVMRIGHGGAGYDDSFIDGALGHNNPIRQLWTEAGDVWGGPLDDKIACIVSIGTGKPALGDFTSSALDLGKRLLAVSTESEVTAGQFYNDHRYGLVKSHRYHRFNVEKGLTKIGLQEAKEKSMIIRATKEYLKGGEIFDKVEACSETLAAREWLFLLHRWPEVFAEWACSRLEFFCSQHHNVNRDDALRWFTNTIAYHSWRNSCRPENWIIWYCTGDHPDFAQMFAAAERDADVLYCDCSEDLKDMFEPGQIDSKIGKIMSLQTALITFSLFSQALHKYTASVPELKNTIADVMLSYSNLRINSLDGKAAIDTVLRKLLIAALSIGTGRRTLILLDHVDALKKDGLQQLISRLQDILFHPANREHNDCRCIIVGRHTSETELSLQNGISSIHDGTEYLECLESLRFENMSRRSDAITVADVDSSHWIWSNSSYLAWERASSGLLWIEGKPGSGKSVLAKSIQRNLVQPDKPGPRIIRTNYAVGAWYYSARERLQSHTMMLRSLLLQILEQNKASFYRTRFRHRLGPFRKERLWARNGEALWDAVLELKIPSDGIDKIYCIIDALDESEDLNQRSYSDSCMLGAYLKELVKEPSRLKVICLSRFALSLEKAFRHFNRIILQQHNVPDIKIVITNGVASLLRTLHADDTDDEDEEQSPIWSKASNPTNLHDHFPSKTQPLLKIATPYFHKAKTEEEKGLQRIEGYLLENADGVILWVTTVLKQLVDRAREPLCTLEEIERELYALPDDLVKLYRKISKDLVNTLGSSKDGLDRARRALTWVRVATARRPLELQDVLDALAIGTSVGTSMRVHSWGSFYRQLQRLCGPFIEIIGSEDRIGKGTIKVQNTDQVQLLHQTVKDFLENEDDAGELYLSSVRAEQLVEHESLQYIEVSLPSSPTPYTPLPVEMGSDWQDNVRVIAAYLEGLPLLRFILTAYPQTRDKVPDRWRFVYANTTDPPLEKLTQSEREGMRRMEAQFATVSVQPGQAAVIQEYIWTACTNGWDNAVTNLLLLSSLRFSPENMPEIYKDEPLISHAALLDAVRHGLQPQACHMVEDIRARGLDLLERPCRIITNRRFLKIENYKVGTIPEDRELQIRDPAAARQAFARVVNLIKSTDQFDSLGYGPRR